MSIEQESGLMREDADREEAATGHPSGPPPGQGRPHDWSLSGPCKHEHRAGFHPSATALDKRFTDWLSGSHLTNMKL